MTTMMMATSLYDLEDVLLNGDILQEPLVADTAYLKGGAGPKCGITGAFPLFEKNSVIGNFYAFEFSDITTILSSENKHLPYFSDRKARVNPSIFSNRKCAYELIVLSHIGPIVCGKRCCLFNC